MRRLLLGAVFGTLEYATYKISGPDVAATVLLWCIVGTAASFATREFTNLR